MNMRQLGGGVALIVVVTLCNILTAPSLGAMTPTSAGYFFLAVVGGAAVAILGWVVLTSFSVQPRTCFVAIGYLLATLLLSGGIAAVGFGRALIVLRGGMSDAQILDALMWMAGSIVIAGMTLVGCIAYWLKLPRQPRLSDDHIYEDSEIHRTPVVMFTSPTPKLKVGADGELVQVAQSSDEGEIVLQGVGNQVTQVVYLEVGRYQLEYQFNTEQLCEIVLVNVDDIESANLLVVRDGGAGSKTFAMQFSGRYVFEVSCPFVSVTWNFRCRLL
jgi:hypothetical protein